MCIAYKILKMICEKKFDSPDAQIVLFFRSCVFLVEKDKSSCVKRCFDKQDKWLKAAFYILIELPPYTWL